MATPEEEIGYIASEEYASRLVTPAPESRPQSNAPSESKESAPSEEPPDVPTDVIHIDDPYHPIYDPQGFAPTPVPDERSRTSREGGDEEPILAADEVRPESAFMHPVVSPAFESTSTTSAAGTRTSSRPISTVDNQESHDGTHEEHHQYEPLFPENKGKVIAATERFKQRPDLLRHKFPSEDVWEDSPNSFHLQTTVSTPDIPKPRTKEREEEENKRETADSGNDRTPKMRPEFVKQRFPSRDIWEDAPESHTLITTIEPSEEDRVKTPDATFKPNLSKPNIPPRPVKRTLSHQSTSEKPSSETSPILNPTTAAAVLGGTAATTGAVAAAATTSPVEERKPPVIPARPKPHVPARPAKPISRASTSESLAKVPSASSTGSTEEAKEAAKSKPAVPARPGGSRIAALKAGFLSDLNSRLQTGPQGPPPKPEEKEKEESNTPAVEKGPLNDARKGRARGPTRRKPAAEVPKATPVTTKPTPEISMTETWNMWRINADGDLQVGVECKEDEKKQDEKEEEEGKEAPVPETAAAATTVPLALVAATSPSPRLAGHLTASPLAKNYAGEPVDPTPFLDTASTGTAETEVFTPPPSSQQPPPANTSSSSPAVEPTRSRSLSPPPPILEKTTTQEARDAHKSPAVEPTEKQDDMPLPKLASPDADSDIQIETPGLNEEAVENVESLIGKKVDESEIRDPEGPES